MAFIIINTKYPKLYDGMPITFKAPCDCAFVEGLTVNSTNFIFKDANRNTLTGIGNLFSEGALVKAILDKTNGFAYIQNADNNKYLEDRISAAETSVNINRKSIEANSANISRNDKRITTIEAVVYGDLAQETEDNTVAYVKDVPSNARGTAKVNTLGGMTYRDGNVLRSAPVTEVESVGRNLVNTDTSVWLKSGAYYYVKLPNNKEYTATVKKTTYTGTEFYFGFCKDIQDVESGFSWIITNGNVVRSGVIESGYNYMMCYAATEGIDAGLNGFEIQVEKGSTATDYEPYVKRTMPIPAEVRALEGYGEGVNESVYNYIDYEKKQFVKRVGCVDLGTLDWNGGETNVFYADIDNNLTPKLEGYVGVCSLYDIVLSTASANLLNKQMVIATLMQTGQAGRTFVKNTAYTDAATFKAAMSGVMLYYELATPEVTDISDILPADNYIGVEGGGTLTFKNEYEFDVPSEVTYITKGATV